METENKGTSGPKRPAKRRRRSRSRAQTPYNPGQICLLLDLLGEFAGRREILGPELAFILSSDIPHLDTFIEYKIRDLVRQQQRLKHLWELSEAV